MMDTDTIKFITEQNKELKEDIKDIIAAHGTAIRGKMESEIDRIYEMDQIRNGKIEKNKEAVYKIEHETRLFRWAHRNPKWSIIIGIVLMAFISLGVHEINVRRTIEKVTKIELKD